MPKEVDANLAWRRHCLEYGASSKQAADDLFVMCSRDLLFWVNTFVWLYEPGGPGAVDYATATGLTVIPFITFDFQDEALLEIDAAIGDHDLCMDKSREEGATFMCLCDFQWNWQFRDMLSFLLVSRNEDAVDKSDDPDSLFWKLDFMLEHQPAWLRPDYRRSFMRQKNNDNGSVMTGSSTTGDVGAGGRRTGILMDEYGRFPVEAGYKALYATQAVTRCRIWNSTPQGMGNAYADVCHDPNVRKLVLDWKDDPRKNPGLYAAPDGKLKLIDEDYWYAEMPDGRRRIEHGYSFVLDGKARSPWYDEQCQRAILPQLIAQELDRDFLGSAYQFFPKAIIDRHEAEHVTRATALGELDFDAETGQPKEFKPDEHGRLQLWCNLGMDGKPPVDRYVIGGDVSAGTGTSNSALSIVSARTGEKVAAYVNPHLAPHELAEMTSALGHWFCDKDGMAALVIVEANGGHNRQFQKTLLGMGYPNVYYRRNEQTVGGRVTRIPGWGSTKDNKRELLEEYARALKQDDYINRDALALDECKQYVHFPDGSIGHAASRKVMDPSGARDNHGDRVIADALAWWAIRGASRHKAESKPEIVPGSVAFRRRTRREARMKVARW